MDEKNLTYIFAEHFNQVHQLYEASARELEGIIGLKASYITAVENHRSGASIRMILSTAETLGLSIDWLMGISPVPYTEETVTNAEKLLTKKIMDLALKNPKYEKYLVLKSGNMVQEWKALSLANRFNLLFLHHCMLGQIALKIESKQAKYNKSTIRNGRIALFRSYVMNVPLIGRVEELIQTMITVASNPEVPVWDLKKLVAKTEKKKEQPAPSTESYETSLFDI